MSNWLRQLILFLNARILLPIAGLFPVWITPNIITGFRLILIIPIIFCLITHFWGLFIVLYTLSLISDSLDGALSRKRNLKTKFGAAFDPVVDKLLHTTLFVFLIPFAPILIISIIALDCIILIGGWITISLFNSNKRDLPIKGANRFGKVKIFFQGMIIFILYCYQIFPETIILWPLVIILIIFAIFFATLSIIEYSISLLRIKYN